MNAPAPVRVGWCPGALRPMASGDGLIVRVKPRGATLTLAQARGLADAALRFGNGALDITGRANVQIRGVAGSTHGPLVGVLARLDLVDADAEAEAARNLVSSPVAGLDADVFDVGPGVAALASALAGAPAFRRLPAKFGFVIDDGGCASLGDVSADIRFAAHRQGKRAETSPGPRAVNPSATGPLVPRSRLGPVPPFIRREGRFRVTLGGDERTAASCAADDVCAVAAALAGVFLSARDRNPDLRRMRDLVERAGAAAVFGRAGIVARSSPDTVEAQAPEVVAGTFRFGALAVVACAARFGRLDARQLLALAEAAAGCGAVELRVAPSRALLVPLPDPTLAARLADGAAGAGFIVAADDPRLRVAACVGAPGCHRASTPVLEHAARVAARLRTGGRGLAVHVSGCAKGCAHEGAAPITLVGRDGRYDLVVDGRASAAPLAHALDIDAALWRAAPGGPGAPP